MALEMLPYVVSLRESRLFPYIQADRHPHKPDTPWLRFCNGRRRRDSCLDIWPKALTRLAETTGTAQVGLATMDRRANSYNSIAPRTDPVMDASYKNYWAFHDPVWPLVTQRPAGNVFSFDSIMSQKDFSVTPVFNEWFRPAEFGLGIIGANLLVGDQVSAFLCVANAPKNDYITAEQALAFLAALPHIDRAVRIHRELRIRDLDHDTAPDRLESLPRSVMLVDGAARVLFATAARTLLGSGRGGLACTVGSIHAPTVGHLARIDRLLRAQGPRA